MSIAQKAREIQSEIVQWRRDLHQIPEVGLEVPQTSAYVARELEKLGVEHKTGVGGYGVVGIIRGDYPGKTIGLRADMDGLAIQEETGLPFASTIAGKMHACGHDSHTAMQLGAAKLLLENKDKLTGNAKLIFQPAEEGPGGAKPMIDDGVMENPKVDAVLGLHIGLVFKEVGTGQVGVGYGQLMACLDRFKIIIKGKGCHGAMPEMGVDPIVIAGQVISTLQTIVSREIAPTTPAVVTIGIIRGGQAYNIIPDIVEMEGTARALDQQVREKNAARIEDIVKQVTRGMRGDYEFEYIFGYPALSNDAEFTKEFVKVAQEIVGEENVLEIAKPTMGGEDFAFFLKMVPGTFFFLGGGNEEKGIVYPHHSAKFDVDEDVFWKGTALLTQGAIDWLTRNC